MSTSFGKILRELREEKEMLQRELAEKLNIERTALVRLESGQYEPNLDTLLKIADFFGVTTDYLLGREIQEIKMQSTDKRKSV